MLNKAERINYFVIFELLKGIKKSRNGVLSMQDLSCVLLCMLLHSESGTHFLEMTAFPIQVLCVFKSVFQFNHAC